MIKIQECMKPKVFMIHEEATVADAAALFRNHHIGTLPVVDGKGCLVGLVRLRDLLSLVMPDFVNLVDHFEFVHDFGALELRQPSGEQLNFSISELMSDPISVEKDTGLIRAAALLHHHNLKDLPVVDTDNILVGIASHVDIGVAMMNHWQLPASREV